MKNKLITFEEGDVGFYCPGCEQYHVFFYKLNKCIQDIQGEIYRESSDYKMYVLGFEAGQNNMLRMLRKNIGKDLYNDLVEMLKKSEGIGGDYFKKINEADNILNNKADNFKEFIEKCRSSD